MAKMEPSEGAGGLETPVFEKTSSSSGSPIIVLLGVVAVAAMALGIVIGFLLGLMF